MVSEPNKDPNSMWNTKSPNPVPDPLVGWTVLILSEGVRRVQRIIGHRMTGPNKYRPYPHCPVVLWLLEDDP